MAQGILSNLRVKAKLQVLVGTLLALAASSLELAHTVEEVNRTAEFLAKVADEVALAIARFKIA